MNTYQNKQAKKYIVAMAISSCVVMLSFIVMMSLFDSWWKKRENEAVLYMLESVAEQYPQVDLAELVQALNYDKEISDRKQADLKAELEKYGIDNSVYYMKEMQSAHRLAIFAGVGLFLMVEIILITIFVLYLKKRQKELFYLENYMDRISDGDYNLDLSDNSEDELSSLKNHMYKLTIMLKEQARIAGNRKVALAESVSDISHQLKTPLTSAQILLDNIMDNPDMDKITKDKFIKEIAKQVTGMRWMIIAMLKLSRLDAGVVNFERVEISLDKMICQAIENLEVMAELKGVTVKYESKDKAIFIVGDFNWNREALQNILKNAIEYSESGESVWIQLQQNDVYTSITVTNKGEPLTQKQQQQIFERYYSEGKFEENSIGIGLPLAKAILEKQGAYLSVLSKNGYNSFIIKYILSP